MIETYTGSRGVIYLTTHDSEGLPVSPDTTPLVVISNPDTNEILFQSQAALIDSDYPYEYKIILPEVIVSFDRILKVTWSYSVYTTDITETDYVYVITPYVTIDEIMSELGFSMSPENPNYFPYEKIRSAERVARMMIDNELGFSLNKQFGTVVAYGNNSDVLIVPKKMLTINTLVENDQLVIDYPNETNIFGYNIEITETGYGIRIVGATPGDDIQEQEYQDIFGISRGKFKDGYRYEVSGVTGWSYVPSEIKQCMFLLINDLLCNDSIWRSKYVKKINSGQMSVELSSQSFNGTGNSIVDALLNKFKMIQAVII